MVGKRSGKALLRDEGLERTDNNMDLTSWPQVNPINQKNYYTEYLRRDDQHLCLRVPEEERRSQMVVDAQDRDRAFSRPDQGNGIQADRDAQFEADALLLDTGSRRNNDYSGAKVIVIHPGSQNLRIGLASDALAKTVPMVIARKSKSNESENVEPKPKRFKADDGSILDPEKMFGQDFASQYNTMCTDLKHHMRANKRRVLPNSKELVVNYNRRTPPETISEHNDPLRIDWTEIPTPSQRIKIPNYFTGMEALRIPEASNPRYKLSWPLRHGWFNEKDYDKRMSLFDDICVIIEDAIKKHLGLHKKRDWAKYGCVFVIPDLYEKAYAVQMLEMMMRDLGFARCAFMQESLAATYGAGYSSACVVDVGAQKTSICCVEEGMCIEGSRVNLKYGGADVTEAFMKMMLFDHFPYQVINLNRRYDFLLAEEIKTKFCTMNEGEISVQAFSFHLRAAGQDTRKYEFKTYDETLLAPQGYFEPSIFDHSEKLEGRRSLIAPSEDLYDGSPNDPGSTAQQEIFEMIAPTTRDNQGSFTNGGVPLPAPAVSTPAKQLSNPFGRLHDADNSAMSQNGTPAPEGEGTPAPAWEALQSTNLSQKGPALRDDILAVVPLDTAIFTAISHGARGDERKMRDFLGGVMVIGGGSLIPGFHAFLEAKLKETRPAYAKDIMIGTAPRELDAQGVIWKGASVFPKLPTIDECWISRLEFDRLGWRVMVYKSIWNW